jgi:hypothetical protein
MNTLFQPPVIEVPAPEEQQEVSSTAELLLALALGVCALAAVRLAGLAAFAIAQVLGQLWGRS